MEIGPLRERIFKTKDELKVRLNKGEFHAYFVAFCTACHVFLDQGQWKLK